MKKILIIETHTFKLNIIMKNTIDVNMVSRNKKIYGIQNLKSMNFCFNMRKFLKQKKPEISDFNQ